LEIYLDGGLNNTNAFTGAPVGNTRDGSIGRSWGGGSPTRHFHGLIDEIGFYSRALAPSEIAVIFNANSDGKCKPAATTCVAAVSGMIGWWLGDGNTNDIVGGNNGTLRGNATFATGEVGMAFSFSGMTDALDVGNPASLQLQNFTMAAWVKRSDATQITHDAPNASFPDGLVFSYGHFGYGFGLRQNGTACRLFLTKVDASDVTSGNLEITDLGWHHVAVTKSNSTVVFYVDGVPGLASEYDPGFSFTTSAAIGARGDNLKNSINATIDEIEVFNLPLSSAQIQEIVSAGSLGQCKNSILRITDIAREADNIRITWNALGSNTYRLQAANANLNLTGVFTDVGPPITIDRAGIITTNSLDVGAITSVPARFYRIHLVP
jgi:hypothetical protein